ncbi:hypothetical protein HpMS107_60830 [Helicobacter pylori]|jgi:hypothetical protein|uniref:Uncharacterized protein n=1 Tax=Cupriavidus metallidurans TaxID=119219 RepID=A0A2L0WZT6_9BURK|nr:MULTISPECIES: hypothetical protein [Cupriavidus]AVA33332.1 hypothetical protein C3Z06_06610 [Cupriavidus metallidurans]QBP09339.1 hypothetical protein DDF84_005970 [Cupriavidus metallidurans]
MADRELLELAAKAAGGQFDSGHFSRDGREWDEWNPLTDDGDALRLAVKLGITVHSDSTFGCTTADIWNISLCESHGDDANAATRRAIVRAAAEIGKVMP